MHHPRAVSQSVKRVVWALTSQVAVRTQGQDPWKMLSIVSSSTYHVLTMVGEDEEDYDEGLPRPRTSGRARVGIQVTPT